MDRRTFIETEAAAATTFDASAEGSPAMARARSDALRIISKGRPNNFRIPGVAAEVAGYEIRTPGTA